MLTVLIVLAISACSRDKPHAPAVTAPTFVRLCGVSLCLGKTGWIMYAGSMNGRTNPTTMIRQGRSLHLNTVRLTDWLLPRENLQQAAYDERAWRLVDRNLAAADQAKLKVLLDLSTYRNLLQEAGQNPYATDWRPFLHWVANRRNTVNGKRLGSDPVIALVSFAGEVEPLADMRKQKVTASQISTFFATAMSYWAGQAPHQLTNSGGLLNLNWSSGIPWRQIFALRENEVCAIHAYSPEDWTASLPAVAQYCRGLGKPWILEEFGWSTSIGDGQRGTRFQQMYDLARAHAAAGIGFWNVGPQMKDTFDVNQRSPLTAEAVRRNAPR